MKKGHRFAHQLPLLIIWLIISVFFWSWIFTFLTDTDSRHKVSVYINADVPDSKALALRLEEVKSPGLRMVTVHPFSYAMFGADDLKQADLYVVNASEAETFREWFRPLPEGWQSSAGCLLLDGVPYGFPMNNGSGGTAASGYITYADQEEYYLFFGASSLHVGGDENSADDQAEIIARQLLKLP